MKLGRSSESSGSPSERRKLFIIDDHSIMREGLRRIMETEGDLTVCGDAANGKEAITSIARVKPDLALVDISLPGSDGVELIKSLRCRFPGLLMLALSMHDESLYAERSLRAGAKGYVMKSSSPKQLLAAVRKVLSGDIYASPALSSRLLHSMISGKKEEVGSMDRLSDRELEIVQLIGRGMSTFEISSRLGISPKTVESHRGKIRTKLALSSGPELVRFSISQVSLQSLPDRRSSTPVSS